MKQTNLLGSWVRRFLTEHLIEDRNYSYNTQQSYRDTLCLLLPFVCSSTGKAVNRLVIEDISPNRVRAFLTELGEKRQSGVSTKNQRLATIRSLANFIGLNSPEHIEWCTSIKVIPLKKTIGTEVTYLEKEEMNALLDAPDCSTSLGKRDHAILLFLYNTGARADELSQMLICDLNLPDKPGVTMASVKIRGKGNKLRQCPLWKQTVRELMPLVEGRPTSECVFINRCNQPMTRFGIHSLVKRHVKRATEKLPVMAKKKISPHTVRHTTATHLLRSGVDINTIRAWLGHVSLTTTNVYAEIDLEMKANALANCEPHKIKTAKPWKQDKQLMEFLHQL